MDIIITLPKSIPWEEYKKELKAVEDGKQVMNFKVRTFPDTKAGDKCYLVWDGYIRGWMSICGLSTQPFICSTTGLKWTGKFIQRTGKFHPLNPLVPMKGFRGFRYMTQEILTGVNK